MNTTEIFQQDVRTRTLHLVDIENLAGGPGADVATVAATLEHYLDAAQWQPGDLVYVAASGVMTTRIAWMPHVEWNLHAASGPDGADLALLAHAAPEFVARRAGRLVIGSGDHIFIDRALAARDLGVEVVVVARPHSVHHGWWQNGIPVVQLRLPDSTALIAA